MRRSPGPVHPSQARTRERARRRERRRSGGITVFVGKYFLLFCALLFAIVVVAMVAGWFYVRNRIEGNLMDEILDEDTDEALVEQETSTDHEGELADAELVDAHIESHEE